MKPYKDLDHDSGVHSYESGDDFIIIKFEPNKFHEYWVYTYTHMSAGILHITKMKELADKGEGLNAYINEHKPEYASKEVTFTP